MRKFRRMAGGFAVGWFMFGLIDRSLTWWEWALCYCAIVSAVWTSRGKVEHEQDVN